MNKYLKNSAKDGVPEICLYGDIGNYDALAMSEELMFSNAETIRVRINSFGGYMMAGYTIISAFQQFRNAGGSVEVTVEGYAMSCASWVLAMGDKGKRYIYDYGEVMIHAPVLDGMYYSDIVDEKEKEIVDRELDKLIVIISACTN